MNGPDYLEPYLRAAARHGGEFSSLLWASPRTQRARFRALAGCCTIAGRTMLDAGCGRADFLDFLMERRMEPKAYIGLEAVEVLAATAEGKRHPNMTIIRGDFVVDPQILSQRADLIVFSGSLNTLKTDDFYATLAIAWQMTASELAFNFLSSPALAAAEHLTWHDTGDVLAFMKTFADEIEVEDTYMTGDCTIVMRK